MNKFKICNVSTCSNKELKEISLEIFKLDQYFFTFKKYKKYFWIKIILHFLKSKFFDLGSLKIIRVNNKFSGFISYYCLSKRNFYLARSINYILRKISKKDHNNFIIHLNNFKKIIAPLPKKGIYLNKIYVTKDYRKKGVANFLINYYLKKCNLENKPAVLHVLKDNYVAIKFYQKYGMQIELSKHHYLLTTSKIS